MVVLSPAFFGKKWANAELDGLTQRQRAEVKVLLPVWYGVEHDDVAHYSLPLADLFAVSSSEGVVGVADKLMEAAGRSPGSADKLAPLEPGPRFRGELRAPNSTTWALVEVGAVPEGDDPITDDLHDAVELKPSASSNRRRSANANWNGSGVLAIQPRGCASRYVARLGLPGSARLDDQGDSNRVSGRRALA